MKIWLFLSFFLASLLVWGKSIAAPAATTTAASVPSDDPFAAIERIELKNGLTLYLAPRPKSGLASVHVEVDVGWDGEDKSNWGVSHLLEHVLFRDKSLHDEMSYLQLIKEAGGSANGETSQRETEFYGTIPPAKATWLLDRFAKMLLHPQITADYVDKEKATVELERGKPGPISEFLGFNPMDYLHFDYLDSHDFWQTEFGVDNKQKFTLTEEQFSTRRLTAAQVQAHYDNYYYPRNMRLYVGGEFDRAEVMKHIDHDWAALPDRPGKKLKPLEEPHIRHMPYARAAETYENPSASLGVKLYDLDLADEEVARSYAEFLAHRLMKEVRNKKGQTYTAQATTSVYKRRIGYSYVYFQTQDKHFEDNVKLVKDFFKNEAVDGGFTDEQIQEAVKLYLDDIRLSGKSAASMVRLAQTENGGIETYGSFRSPQTVLSHMPPAEYRARLAKIYASSRRYQHLTEPPLFFAYDSHLCAALALIFSFIFFRRLLTKKFDHAGIRWVRKMRYLPLKIVEGLALALGVALFAHLAWVYETAVLAIPYVQGSLFFTEYVRDIVATFCFVLCLQGVLSFFPWKLMVVGQELWVKSITYYARCFPLARVDAVETCHIFSLKLLKKLPSIAWRFHFFHLYFWQKGLLLTARDAKGKPKSYFFGVKNASLAAAELITYRDQAVNGHRSVEAA